MNSIIHQPVSHALQALLLLPRPTQCDEQL
jgi:hypothetical protein